MIAGKVILLTGASEGIGRATALRLGARGATLVLAARSEVGLQAVADELAHLPGRRLVVPGDLSEPATREALVATALQRFGRVDVLVNNAAAGMDAPLEASPLADARELFELNFFAPYHLCQLVLPAMREQGSGQIVQVSSIVGLRASPNQSVYCATKYALNGLSDSLRVELVGSGIVVTDIYPGVTATGFVPKQRYTVRREVAPFAVSAERVAGVIESAIERRSRARYVRWQDRAGVYLSRALPGLAEWALARGFRFRRRSKGA